MTEKCTICGRYPKRMNNDHAECSHVDCPHRRKAWSEGAQEISRQTFKGPWEKNVSSDPKPLTGELK